MGKQALVARSFDWSGQHSAAHSAALEQRRVATLHRLPSAKQITLRDPALRFASVLQAASSHGSNKVSL